MTVPRSQAGVAAFLAGLTGAAPVETHVSAVFRGPDRVFKMKLAVRLPFLDCTALERRRALLERELALNGPAVPGLYHEVVPITRRGDGYALGGDGAVVDWVLTMDRVPEGDFLDTMAAEGRITGALCTALADAVVRLHAGQPVVPDTAPVERLRTVMRGNAEAAVAAGVDAASVARWAEGMAAAIDAVAGLVAARAPLVRRAHGDLHLGNMLLWRGAPAAFDSLEFDEALATIDPGYDLAFLLMDLERLVSRAAANRVLSRYVARTGDAGLVGPLPPFLSLRAMIRAHVAASRQQDPAPLVQAALDYLRPVPPRVVAVGGLMGTGKTTLARGLAPGLGAAPGALVLRSDEVRKRLFGCAPEAALPEAAYTPEANRRTEEALLAALRQAVAGGHAVVLDATFLDPGARARARESAGAPFLGLWLDAPLGLLRERVAARRGDASDATRAVLDAAAARLRPPTDWCRIDAAGPPEQAMQAARAVL